MRAIRRTFGVVFGASAMVVALALGLVTVERLDRRPRTDDAYLQADVVHMAPDVSGRVVELKAQQNQAVRSGDILLVIEQEPYRLKVAQAVAQVRMLEASLDDTAKQVASQAARAEAAESNILSAETALAQSTTTLARLQPLLARGYVSAETVDQARTSQRAAQIALVQTKQQAQAARTSVLSTKPTEEQLASARASLALAERDLRLTVVRSPCDGRVTGLETSAGEYASAGRPLFTIINTEQWYAVGNFREIDLAGLAVGQRALVYALSDPNRPMGGVIDGLGWGVVPDEGSSSTSLPRVPRSLNWVRIAQRFPVRIRLDPPPGDIVRVGASAVVVVER